MDGRGRVVQPRTRNISKFEVNSLVNMIVIRYYHGANTCFNVGRRVMLQNVVIESRRGNQIVG